MSVHVQNDEDCLLCGSRIEVSQIQSDYREKWFGNICSLYEIVGAKQIHQIEQILCSSSFCMICYEELREIDNLYTAIARFNSKLQLIKLECQSKLKNVLGSPSLQKSRVNSQYPHSTVTKLRSVQGEVHLRSPKSNKMSHREKLYECMTGNLIILEPPENIALQQNQYEDDNIQLVELEVEVAPSPEIDLMSVIENIGFMEGHRIGEINNRSINSVSQENIVLADADPSKVQPEESSLGQAKESQTHSGDGTIYHCTYPGCSMKFKIEARLDGHFNRSHKGDHRPFKCQECTFSFITYNELIQHGNVHLGLNPFKCPNCDMVCPTKLRLQRHIRRHHGPKKAECQYCGKKFQYFGCEFNLHVESHSTTPKLNKLFHCEICNIPFRSIKILHRHLNREHRNSEAFRKVFRFHCRYCGKSFTRNYFLQIHESTHPEYQADQRVTSSSTTENEANRSVECGNVSHCSKDTNFGSTNSSSQLDSTTSVSVDGENLIEIKEEPYACDENSENAADLCEAELITPSTGTATARTRNLTLSRNLYTEYGEESESLRNLRQKYNLKPCIVKVHPLKIGTQKLNRALEQSRLKRQYVTLDTNPPRKIVKRSMEGLTYSFRCSYEGCSSKFLDTILLEGHIKKKHLGINRPYECEICHTKWISHNELMEHGNIHLGVTPFDCPECGEKFATKSILGQHRRKTHRSKNIQCKYCGKLFLYAGMNYKVHVQRHMNEKPFSCDLCGNSFVAKAELTYHQKKYHAEELEDVKLYPCQLCNKSYSRPHFLKRHEFVKHSTSPTRDGRCRRGSKNDFGEKDSRSVSSGDSNSSHDIMCHVCGFEVDGQERLDEHLAAEHSEREF